MAKAENLVGQVFGRLTVVERAENKGGSVYWLCRCSCGNEVVVQAGHLKCSHSRSCGCLNKELSAKRATKHGLASNKIYNTWQGMKQRCLNPHHEHYPIYGGRNIKIFEGWINDFGAFFEYVSKLEHFNEPNYTLDRIDVNGNYAPGNLRFITQKEQNRNRRDNVWVEYEGEMKTLAEVAELTGIKYATLRRRYRRGDRGENLFRPIGGDKIGNEFECDNS